MNAPCSRLADRKSRCARPGVSPTAPGPRSVPGWWQKRRISGVRQSNESIRLVLTSSCARFNDRRNNMHSMFPVVEATCRTTCLPERNQPQLDWYFGAPPRATPGDIPASRRIGSGPWFLVNARRAADLHASVGIGMTGFNSGFAVIADWAIATLSRSNRWKISTSRVTTSPVISRRSSPERAC